MHNFSNKIINVEFSGIGDMVNLANRIGGNMIRLEIGDVDFSPPKCVLEALKNAYLEKKTHYPPFRGYPELLELISEKLEKENKIESDPENLIVTSGGAPALYVLLISFLNPGDEVLITNPVWCHFEPMISLAGGIPILAPLDGIKNFRLKINELENLISKKTKLLLFNFPNNPTGAVIPKEDMLKIIEIATNNDLMIISDEEYEAFVYNSNKHESFGSLYENTITLQSFSKTYAMSGFRLGYIHAPKEYINNIAKANLYTVMYAPSISQIAAIAAMEEGHDFIKKMVSDFEKRMDLLSSGLNRIDGISCRKSQGSLYVWPNIKDLGLSSFELCKKLIEKTKVVTVAGSEFGSLGEGYLRVSLGARTNQIKKAVERINYFVNNI